MLTVDRCFRALARRKPDVVVALIRTVVPELLSANAAIGPDDVGDPTLDLPPPIEADFVATLSPDEVLHVEFQGYRDSSFRDRLFRYQLGLVLRHPGRRVISVAVWTMRPPANQRVGLVEQNGVFVFSHAIVLPDVPVSLLLANPTTVCFAPAADLEGRDALEVCRQVARRLRERGADWDELLTAVVAAGAAKRYSEMTIAMKDAEFPVLIEDLILIGLDQGLEKGRAEGHAKGRAEGRNEALSALRDTLIEVCALRKLELDDAQRKRIGGESSLERLRAWMRAAAIAETAQDVFAEA